MIWRRKLQHKKNECDLDIFLSISNLAGPQDVNLLFKRVTALMQTSLSTLVQAWGHLHLSLAWSGSTCNKGLFVYDIAEVIKLRLTYLIRCCDINCKLASSHSVKVLIGLNNTSGRIDYESAFVRTGQWVNEFAVGPNVWINSSKAKHELSCKGRRRRKKKAFSNCKLQNKHFNIYGNY